MPDLWSQTMWQNEYNFEIFNSNQNRNADVSTSVIVLLTNYL